MARTPDIQSKTNRLTFIPLSPEEEKVSQSFKKLCVQDETTQHDMLLEAIQLLFVKHNLDLGGNPQRQLLSFQENMPQVEKCKCNKPASVWVRNVENNQDYKFCSKCFSALPMRHDTKMWCILKKGDLP